MRKMALKIGAPRLKPLMSKMTDQVVKNVKPKRAPKMKLPEPTAKMGDRPTLEVGHAGDMGRMVPPPAVKI